MNNKFIRPQLRQYINDRIEEFDRIDAQRKSVLETAAGYVQKQLKEGKPANLTFICTHNSRRSHISQIWAQVAAYFYHVQNVATYSGGTEATAFNPNAVKALKEAGLEIIKMKDGANPLYEVKYAEDAEPVRAFSKLYDEGGNPAAGFAAVMTCSHADENCPFIPGASLRISITYDDPKEYDHTPQQDAAYKERTRQIAREMLYMFSKINRE